MEYLIIDNHFSRIFYLKLARLSPHRRAQLIFYYLTNCFFYKARANGRKKKKSGSQLSLYPTLIFCQMLINILLKKGKKIHKKTEGHISNQFIHKM